MIRYLIELFGLWSFVAFFVWCWITDNREDRNIWKPEDDDFYRS